MPKYNQNAGGYYPAVGEGIIAGRQIFKGYHDMTPPIFKGELLKSTLQEVSCGPQASSQKGGRRRNIRTKKSKRSKINRKSKKSKKNRRKSKKNKRKTKKRTYRK